MTTEPALLRLLAWLSPAFPTGGYAYSHGLEWAVQEGDVTDGATLRPWLEDLLQHGSLRTDTILLRHAHRASHDTAALLAVAELAQAAATGRERRLETLRQGAAFIAAAAAWHAPVLDALSGTGIAYPVAVGALAAAHAIEEDDAACAYLQAVTANLISAAIRLVPLGQSAGLRVLAALEPAMLAVLGETRAATLDDIGTACFRSDISGYRHETQYTRLFLT